MELKKLLNELSSKIYLVAFLGHTDATQATENCFCCVQLTGQSCVRTVSLGEKG